MADERENSPEPRPAPQYGEYAPEGWSWSPEGKGEDDAAKTSGTGDAGGDPGPAAPSSGRLPGVPHNLGAGAAGARRPSQSPDQQQSYRSTEPAAGGSDRARSRALVDRVVTIVLLALGAYGALNMAFMLQNLREGFNVQAVALGAEGFRAPDSVGTVGIVGAVAILAVYAVNVIFSIQRMRARKLAFWVPLAALGLALLVLFVCTMIAMAQMPELLQLLQEAANDPDALSKLLNATTTP